MLRSLVRRAVPRSVRLWLRHPVQSFRWLGHQSSARRGGAARIRMRDDWEITCHPASIDPFAFERDEPELAAELDGFIDTCSPGMVLFDIGAHYGLFALAALRWGGPDARVFAVDPSDAALEVFDENMRLASAGERVQRFRAAVGAADGEMSVLTGGAGAWHMMVASGAPRADAVTVPSMTLGTLAARAHATPTHLKIDVEGGEDAVLAGAEAILRTARPIVFLELHGGILRQAGCSPIAVLDRLVRYGYCRLEVGGHRVTPAEAAAMNVARIVCRVL